MEKQSGYEYEVFLSFRGPDTRCDITDYLYTIMIGAGIRVYKDDEELRTGKEIGGQLLQAIEQSKISIPIFSKGYADSPWCLKELVKMVESKNTRSHTIKPIFYDVPPSEVKYQTDHYGNAIVSHAKKKRFDDETIDKWKAALSEVGALKGWDLHGMPNRGKGEFAKEVVNDVLSELKTTYLEVSDCLVKVDIHADEIMTLIGAYNDETKVVGIYGMGGVGKTTLAKLVYNQLSINFVDCCFLCDIRKTDITCLQNQLISTITKMKWLDIKDVMNGKKAIKERLCSKKVLLLLDDADDISQLDALIQKREWFGKGSKIIITTRDQGILKVPTFVDGTYELTGMSFDHSLQLFSKHAFRSNFPMGQSQYIFHSERAVNICGGLPLALEVIGSLLSGQSIEEWDTTLKEVEESPHEKVEKTLMISINSLNREQRKIFLDVACFFIGFDKRVVIHMWESCKFLPAQSLRILQQRSLIKIREDNQLWMHDVLRDIGRNLIEQESDKKPEKQQWVWTHAQASEFLEKMQVAGGVLGIGSIEAIRIKLDELSQSFLIGESLSSLPNLRFLHVDGELSMFLELEVSGQCWSNFLQTKSGPFFLPELRWLSWNFFPTVFKFAHFSVKKLVILDLSRSKITGKWDGWSHIKFAEKLKVLNLTGCTELRKTPDLSSHVHLERLILERCMNLVHIHPSIGSLKRLVFLNLKYCGSLRKLPDEIEALESLTELLLDKTSIEEISKCRGMEKLEILSLVKCKRLSKFSFVGCAASSLELSSVDNPLIRLPKSIENFKVLIELNLSESAIWELPDSIGNMKNLKVLKMRKSFLEKLPSAIGMLEKLQHLEVGGRLSMNLRGKIPHEIGKLPFLRILVLVRTKISAMPPLPESLITLKFHSTKMAKLPDLSNLSNLRRLYLCLLHGGNELEEDPSGWSIKGLRMLEDMELVCHGMTILSSDIVFLSRLERLKLICCHLQCLPRLPANLSFLHIDCRDLKTTNDLSNLKALRDLYVGGCCELREIQGLEGLENLRSLVILGVRSLAKLPDLSTLRELRTIKLRGCYELVEIQGIAESVELLDIENCSKLQGLPDPSSFKNLRVQIQ